MHSISAGSAPGTPIVCMPGYAAGAAFFYRNLPGLSQHARVQLVDWLGTGLSGRPPFHCRTREETEDWFVDSLERWRVAQGHTQMVLVGHSLGGYLSTSYALKYPDRVAHLVLVNPAGMVRSSPSSHRAPHSLLSATLRILPSPPAAPAAITMFCPAEHCPAEHCVLCDLQMQRPADLPLPEMVRSPFSFGGMVYRAMTCAWHAGITPGSVVRTFGPFSRRFTQGYADRRMHHSLGLPREHCEAFEPYMFEVLGGKGSGEVRC